VTAFASQLPAEAGRSWRQQEMFSTAIGSLVTTIRAHRDARADPVVERLAPVLRTPDQDRARAPPAGRAPCRSCRPRTRTSRNQGARFRGGGDGERGPGHPTPPRIRPVASVTVTMPLRLPTSCAMEAGTESPAQANTTSCSGVWSISATATGASVRWGSTRYCSRQRCQEIATSGPYPSNVVLTLYEPFPCRVHRARALGPWKSVRVGVVLRMVQTAFGLSPTLDGSGRVRAR